MSDAPQVTFITDRDDDAEKINSVLHALGYDVTRASSLGEIRSTALAERLALTEPEKKVLELITIGLDYEAIARSMSSSEGKRVTKATVKWHAHNLFAKADVGGREGLLRLLIAGPHGRRGGVS